MLNKKNILLFATVSVIQFSLAMEKSNTVQTSNTQSKVTHTTTKSSDGSIKNVTRVSGNIDSISTGYGNMTFDKNGNMVEDSCNGVFIDGKQIDKK